MKLHRIIAMLLCLMALACAGALADGQTEIGFDSDDRRLIIDRNNMVDFGAYVDGDVAEGAVVVLDIDGIADGYEIGLDEDGRLMPVELSAVEAETAHYMTLTISGHAESAISDNFYVNEFVSIDNSIENAQFIDMMDGTHAVIINVDGRKEEDFTFKSNIGDKEIDYVITYEDNKRLRGSMEGSHTFGNLSLDFNKREIKFTYGDYEVAYVIYLCEDEEEYIDTVSRLSEEKSLNEDALSGNKSGEDETAPEMTVVPAAGTADDPAVAPTVDFAEALAEDPEDWLEAEPAEDPAMDFTGNAAREPDADENKSSNIEIFQIIALDADKAMSFDIETVSDGVYEATVYGSRRFRIIGTSASGASIVAKQKDSVVPLRAVSNKDMEWELDFDLILSDVTLEIYAEGSEDEVTELTVHSDVFCEAVRLDPVAEGDDMITGVAEPGAEVFLQTDGSLTPEVSEADDEGKFIFDGLEVSQKARYEIYARDMAGNESDRTVVDVEDYKGSDDLIELTLNFIDSETKDGAAYIGMDARDFKIRIESVKDADVQLYIRGAEADGEAEKLGTVIETDSDNAWGLSAAPNVDVTIGTDDIAADGTYEIFARYDDFNYDYESQALTLVVDRAQPEAPVIVTSEIFDDENSIVYALGEDCDVEIMIDGIAVFTQSGESGENIFSFDTALEEGMEITLAATDAAGNRSEASEGLLVQASEKLRWESGDVFWNTDDPFELMTISGCFMTDDENANVEVIFECNGREYGDLDVEIHKTEADDGDFAYRFEFTAAAIDTGNLPVGKDITVSVNVTVEGEKMPLKSGTFRLEKDVSRLMIRVLLLLVIAAGFVAALAAFVKVNGQIAVLKKSALDSGNESNLTIRRRGYSRAGK